MGLAFTYEKGLCSHLLLVTYGGGEPGGGRGNADIQGGVPVMIPTHTHTEVGRYGPSVFP